MVTVDPATCIDTHNGHYNPLVTNNPNALLDWDWTNNGPHTPWHHSLVGRTECNWSCHTCGHHGPAYLQHRKNGHGCLACAGKVVIVGKNDLAHTHREIAALLDPTVGANTKTARDVTAASKENMAWLCPHCHRPWVAPVCHVTRGYGCRKCSPARSAATRRASAMQGAQAPTQPPTA